MTATSGWIQLNGTKAGQGEARIPFAVVPNGDPAIRRGTVGIGDKQVTITQEAASCRFVVEPAGVRVGAAGGRATVQVSAGSPLCTWTARSEAAWLAIVDGAQGAGSGQVVFDVQATGGPPRAGSLTVAGHTVTVTQGDGCSSSISPTVQSVGASGGSGSVSVTTGEGCVWTARSDTSWISIATGRTGAGPGTVTFAVPAWDGPPRTGSLQIAGHLFTITQTAGCSYDIAPSSATVPPTGGSVITQVQTAAGCAWDASSGAPWIAITSGASGSGPGEVRFSVTAHGGPPRTGLLTIAGRSFTLTQASGCSVSISPATGTFDAAGGSGSVAISAGAGCAWTAVASQPWVRITSGASGSGAGSVGFTVEPNDGAARQASIAVGGQVFTIQQSAGCTYEVTPATVAVPAAGGDATVQMQTAAGCAWSAASGAPWIVLAPPASGTGPADVRFSVTANSGAERSGALTIAGRTVSVVQAGGCHVSLDPSSQAFDSGGGSGSVAVSAGAGCAWSAAASETWVQVTSGASGSGPGSVTFTVAPNAGAARQASIDVAGQLFAIKQNAGCAYALSASGVDVEASGGPGAVTVTTQGSCTWSAASAVPWIQITSGESGVGSGSVGFSVAAHDGPERQGVLTIAGEPFTVRQASGCAVVLTPSAQTFAPEGGPGSIAVAAGEGCGWSAATAVEWIAIDEGNTGSGDGLVRFSVQPNTGDARSGQIVVGGQAFTVTQTGP